MKHHRYNPHFPFVKDPAAFSKYTPKELLQYCLGATLYMPASKAIESSIIKGSFPGLTSMVMCLEDAVAEEEVPSAELNIIRVLKELKAAVDAKSVSTDDLPLFFVRVRSVEQFVRFSSLITADLTSLISGFVFPKFSTKNGGLYLEQLRELNACFEDTLYGMPILESREIAFKETRESELSGIRELLKPYEDLILNIRVGATDFSSKFGVRRGIDYSIYDIVTVRDCLSDILNFLGREDDDYVLSAPVWEYFLADRNTRIGGMGHHAFHSSLMKRNEIVNNAIDGLLREVILDKANGFVGKTIIHPSHLSYVNAMQAVTREEFEDANQILSTSSAVVKSSNGNKMNETNPHRNWAKKVVSRAEAYGVIEDESSYLQLAGSVLSASHGDQAEGTIL